MRRGIWLLSCVLAGCARHAEVANAPAPIEPPADPWVLTCVDPNANEPAWLSNGLIGARIGRDGTGVGQPFFAIDEYDATGEEKIRTLSNPLGVEISLDGKAMSPAEGSLYRQTLDMRTSALHTSWLQDGTKIEIVTYIHPTERTLAQKLLVKPAGDHNVEVRSFIAGGSAAMESTDSLATGTLITDGGMVVVSQSVEGPQRPWRQVDKGLEYSAEIKSGTTLTIERTVQLSESPNSSKMLAARFPGSGMKNGKSERSNSPDGRFGFERVQDACVKEWARRWKTDVQIDGPVEDQQAVRSFLFYLRMAISPDGRMGVSPMALSNAQYNGHVFWDADIWVFPALALVDPERARVIPAYRLALAEQARKNAGVPDALRYPWESSVTGKETVLGPSRKELHITGSVLWGLRQAEAFGLAGPRQVDALAIQAGRYYETIGKDGQIRDVMSPDENHTGDNDLYTNLLAQWLTGKPFKLPKDDKTFLTYDGDSLRGYKQAAAILSVYPLQYGPAEKQAKAMMDRFADKVTANGPAMSDSVNATIWARIGETDKAYDAWRKSWGDFTHNPLLLFSEKRKKPVTYFVTGAGGTLQSVLYGFLGFRLDSRAESGSVWSMKLVGEHYLSVRPHLPTAWKSVRFANFSVLGRRFTLTATHQGATVSPGE